MKIALLCGESQEQRDKCDKWIEEIQELCLGECEVKEFFCSGSNAVAEMKSVIEFDPTYFLCYNLDMFELYTTGGDFFVNQLYGWGIIILDKKENYSILSDRINVTNIFFTEDETIFSEIKFIAHAPKIELLECCKLKKCINFIDSLVDAT